MPEGTFPELDVSRETFGQLERYAALLTKWNEKINLVGRRTIGDLWSRHILDSVQVYRAAPPCRRWLDLGSGAGLPGAVVAILAKGQGTSTRVTCVDSDLRKGAFLRVVAHDLDVPLEVVTARIEDLPPCGADVVSARALAPLPVLLPLAARHLAHGGICLFPKGKSWREELEAARRSWHFSCDVLPSRTRADAVILRIGEPSRV